MAPGRDICRNHLGPVNPWNMASILADWFWASILTRDFQFGVRDVIFWTPSVFSLETQAIPRISRLFIDKKPTPRSELEKQAST
jgi:hypothetical protein